ncbi:MAG: FAD-dependent oxidoreductase [Eubacteriales bacterium]
MNNQKNEANAKFPNLFSPIRIGNIKFKNRIMASPTSPSMITEKGHFTPEIIAYLEEKAMGGVSVVTYGESIVHSATGKSHNKQLQLDSFGVKQMLAEAARAIHNAGAYANIQLSHGGKYGGLVSVGGDINCCEIAYGPSAETTPFGEVIEMPKELIHEIIESYGKAAKLCKDCGFDMVQVHMAHGWLFSQFLSPTMNKREDEFGGSLENRARFMILALDAVRKAVGPRFPIEARISGDDLTEDGLNMEECVKVAQMIDDKVDLFNVSCGNHEDGAVFCRTHPSAFYPRGVNVYLSAEIKKHVNTPVACVGSLNDPAHMEEIIATGQADIVELGRALLADPYLPKKAKEGNEKDITYCLRCYECFEETSRSETLKCVVNPTMGQQLAEKFPRKAPERKKKVLIIGGGPAGMQAAITSAQRGHDVTLVEKSGELGGNLIPGGAAYFKQDIHKLKEVLIGRLKKTNAKVILNKEATIDYVKKFNPEVLFIAIGSEEIVPPIPGIDLPHVVSAKDAELHPEKLGKRVAIVGGGLVGSEIAISLNHEGKECSIIEMKPVLAEEVNSFYRGGFLPNVEKAANIYLGSRVKAITKEGVECTGENGDFLVEADSIIRATGYKSPYAKVDKYAELASEYYIIGDCKNVGRIYEALNNGYFSAMCV